MESIGSDGGQCSGHLWLVTWKARACKRDLQAVLAAWPDPHAGRAARLLGVPTIVVCKALEVLLVVEVTEGQDEEVAGIMLCPPLDHGRHYKGVVMPLGCLHPLQYAELRIYYSQSIGLCIRQLKVPVRA